MSTKKQSSWWPSLERRKLQGFSCGLALILSENTQVSLCKAGRRDKKARCLLRERTEKGSFGLTRIFQGPASANCGMCFLLWAFNPETDIHPMQHDKLPTLLTLFCYNPGFGRNKGELHWAFAGTCPLSTHIQIQVQVHRCLTPTLLNSRYTIPAGHRPLLEVRWCAFRTGAPASSFGFAGFDGLDLR